MMVNNFDDFCLFQTVYRLRKFVMVNQRHLTTRFNGHIGASYDTNCKPIFIEHYCLAKFVCHKVFKHIVEQVIRSNDHRTIVYQAHNVLSE